jgi:YtxH-like protein
MKAGCEAGPLRVPGCSMGHFRRQSGQRRIWQGILIVMDRGIEQIHQLLKINSMSNSSKVLLGLVVGAAIGGALGILLAPDKGSETRRKIAEKGSDLGDSLSDLSDSIKDRFNGMVDGVKENFNKTKSSMS